jgi:peptidoglycan/xylan/chitin deacetylase (PgdA/CDA1 family)
MGKARVSITAIVTAILGIVAVLLLFAGGADDPTPAVRSVAVTFDDLPMVSVPAPDLSTHRRLTKKLVSAITAESIPAVGFANEDKVTRSGKPDPERVALLEIWADAGLELGNHTYSHPDLHKTSIEEFRREVVRGEPVVAKIQDEHDRPLRYFRHPMLHTGMSLETKTSLEEFLGERGYTVAPVTIDNSEWIFAAAYAKALGAGDRKLADRVRKAYVPYMDRKFDYFERQSRILLGYEVRQVLLLHANALNADTLPELVSMIRGRGYTFISLEEALQDPAYALEDTYTGPAGISWLHRWAISLEKKDRIIRDEPEAPDWVLTAAGFDRE